MILPIVTVPQKVLISKSKLVKSFGPNLQKLVADMSDTLISCIDPIGVGLAAPQVGVNLRVFISRPNPNNKIKIFINPEILSIDPDHVVETPNPNEDQNEAFEGCLSIPRIWSPVSRPQKITISWQDIKGKSHQKEFEGFDAVIIQHEVDHLDGILFTRRASEQNAIVYEEKNKKLYEMKI